MYEPCSIWKHNVDIQYQWFLSTLICHLLKLLMVLTLRTEYFSLSKLRNDPARLKDSDARVREAHRKLGQPPVHRFFDTLLN